MIKRRKITTKVIEILGEDGSVGEERPIIDEDLQLLAWATTGNAKVSGSLETIWFRGGLREPKTILKKEHRAAIAKRLKAAFLPRQDFTGKVIFRLNSGELSGQPEII